MWNIRTKDGKWYVLGFHGCVFVSWVCAKDREHAAIFSDDKLSPWEFLISEMTGMAIEPVEAEDLTPPQHNKSRREGMTLQQAIEIIQSELTDEKIRITADSVTIDVDGWEYELLEEGDADKQIASLLSRKS